MTRNAIELPFYLLATMAFFPHYTFGYLIKFRPINLSVAIPNRWPTVNLLLFSKLDDFGWPSHLNQKQKDSFEEITSEKQCKLCRVWIIFDE